MEIYYSHGARVEIIREPMRFPFRSIGLRAFEKEMEGKRRGEPGA